VKILAIALVCCGHIFSSFAPLTIPVAFTVHSNGLVGFFKEITDGHTKHRNAITNCLRFEAFTAVTMKNAIFWDVTPCGSCKNRRFGGT
jgi:hypothetical protein